MQEFDIFRDHRMNETEFIEGISKWLVLSRHPADEKDHDRPRFFNTSSKQSRSEQQSLLTQKQEISTTTQKNWLNYVKAALLLLVGTAISALLGLPLMQTLQEFSSDVNIPSFLVTYVVVPLALNIRQALATITSAREKTEKAISLTFSEV
ncbi:sodium/calcium exchanger NCL2-like [Juglans microcarpa x Juglans regia]|uniref:sodium/calcium exchanger NCL2-like n=1 Tax=Juglans microcarpa x Juglans regia TaxID=2249226 RepID=UPI001B7E874B|nr:sodium/calcium exchanger NCL2-like [Juglans microcarpa x Juglans regia]